MSTSLLIGPNVVLVRLVIEIMKSDHNHVIMNCTKWSCTLCSKK